VILGEIAIHTPHSNFNELCSVFAIATVEFEKCIYFNAYYSESTNSLYLI